VKRRSGESALAGLHDDIAPALANLKAGERLLGLDLGTKTIGIALSDVERRIASPLQTIKRASSPWTRRRSAGLPTNSASARW
jgi:putative Holliday junction resolvase